VKPFVNSYFDKDLPFSKYSQFLFKLKSITNTEEERENQHHTIYPAFPFRIETHFMLDGVS